MSESPRATFEKRFMQAHYSYRDSYVTTTGPDPTALTASYVFGAAARAVSRYNWPSQTDTDLFGNLAAPCFARSVMVQCTEDAWVIITSVNPYYTQRFYELILQGKSATVAAAELAALEIPETITEVPAPIPKNAMITFNPTFGVAITFYYTGESGTIRFWIEGNTEGRE